MTVESTPPDRSADTWVRPSASRLRTEFKTVYTFCDTSEKDRVLSCRLRASAKYEVLCTDPCSSSHTVVAGGSAAMFFQ